ncbi:PLP-dependent aminotransferase family protein [Paremcibacter congregatus]|nr:PLP-dependent aminotransferase family protein [Paremcibacter congregatus]
MDILKKDIQSGRLVLGERLPTQQNLAESTGIAKSTVARVYQEAHAESLIKTIVGRGSFVAGKSDPFFQAVDLQADETLDLRLDYPIAELGISLSETLIQIAEEDCCHLLTYQEHAGRLECREAGVRWLALNDVTCSAEDIVMTSGAQHALTVCLSSVAKSGDSVVVEELTYPGIRETAEMLGINLIPVTMDDNGINPDSLTEILFAHRNIKALYSSPTIQNPTTIFTPEYRRIEIGDICHKHGIFIIEDDIHRLFSDERPAPYVNLLPELTFFIAGLSKAVCGGLRVAYVVPPAALFKTVKRRILATHWTLPPLMAEIATRWINDGTAMTTLSTKKTEAEIRHRLAYKIIGAPFIKEKAASSYVWIDLPSEWTAEIFINEAFENRVAVLGDGSFRVTPEALKPGIRLCLGAAPDRQRLETGLIKIAAMLKDGPGGSFGII